MLNLTFLQPSRVGGLLELLVLERGSSQGLVTIISKDHEDMGQRMRDE